LTKDGGIEAGGSMAGDRHEAEQLHREALHCVVHDIMRWLVEQRRLARVKVNQGARSKCPQKKEAAVKEAIRAEVFVAAIEKLKWLRKKHGEMSARASAMSHGLAEGQAISDPSPEEIAKGCEEIQAKWSDSERASRSSVKVQPVEAKPTTFIF